MIGQFTKPAYIINRDITRELRMICPGTHEKVMGVRVVRLDGEQSHLYAINGYTMDVDCAADVLTGYTPMPPKPKPVRKPANAPKTLVLVSSPVTVRRTTRAPKPKDKPEKKPLNTLPMFMGMVA